ncbi:UNVERIFIED_CONTAM: Myosin-binding protein 7 [Sesamum angustifolium]|uniref:Myosin-binding protein 7 n=1 Tax=Sesamum angustifolium TaxID=2727405 RepID=A0AAW2MVM9_9LAMI
MRDYNTVTSEADVSALKDTLCAQQELLQKLYNELDAEREASASAASEALSVILRLQGEKAAVKMESEQYKRLSEEKICHAEESLAIFEDIIYQKEMELASLDYQVQAYRYKLLSIGHNDLGIGEVKFPEHLLQRNESLGGESSLQSKGRRNSLPLSLKYKKVMNERERSTSPELDLISKVVEEQTGQCMYDPVSDQANKADYSTPGGISSYWEQIRKLDVQVKEIVGANYENSRSGTQSPSSVSSQISAGLCYLSNSGNQQNRKRLFSPEISICNPGERNKVAVLDETDRTECSKNNVAVDHSCSPNVHDVFEVPQVDQTIKSCNSLEKCEKEDVVHPEAAKVYAQDEPDQLKKVLQSKYFCKPSGAADMNCRLAVVEPRTSVSETLPLPNQLNRTSEILEAEGQGEYMNREEELKLLRDIKELLNTMHEEIRSRKVKNSSTRDEPSLLPLQEVLTHDIFAFFFFKTLRKCVVLTISDAFTLMTGYALLLALIQQEMFRTEPMLSPVHAVRILHHLDLIL